MDFLNRIINWFIGPGLKPILIIIGFLIIYLIFREAIEKFIKTIILTQEKRGRTKKEQKLRTKTLSHVITKTGAIIIVTIAILMLLQSLGVEITALLAGAGIAGIAIGLEPKV